MDKATCRIVTSSASKKVFIRRWTILHLLLKGVTATAARPEANPEAQLFVVSTTGPGKRLLEQRLFESPLMLIMKMLEC